MFNKHTGHSAGLYLSNKNSMRKFYKMPLMPHIPVKKNNIPYLEITVCTVDQPLPLIKTLDCLYIN